MPPRYGSSAEDSSSPPKVDEAEKPKKRKGKKVKKDADHAPLTSGKKGHEDDDDDDESDDLDGLEGVLNQAGDKDVNRKPAAKTKDNPKKRPAASRGSKKKDHIGCVVDIMNMYSNWTMVRVIK